MTYLAPLYTFLKMQGITRVLLNFDGSSDSGYVESPMFYKADGSRTDDVSTMQLPWIDDEFIENHKTVSAILEDLAYGALTGTGLDWVNNDGGWGHIEIDFTQSPPKIDMHVNVRRMEHDSHVFEVDELWNPL